jgi:hypothetical protein
MGTEMKKYLVGPMPAQQFLDDFPPVSQLCDFDQVPRFVPKCYQQTINSKKEKNAYQPFVIPF